MIFIFDDFELDTGKVELSQSGTVVPLEPQVFALLQLLIENRELHCLAALHSSSGRLDRARDQTEQG